MYRENPSISQNQEQHLNGDQNLGVEGSLKVETPLSGLPLNKEERFKN